MKFLPFSSSEEKRNAANSDGALQLLAAAVAGAPDCLLGGFMAQQQPASAGGTCLGYSSGYQSSAPEEESRTGYVLVTSSPAGASVYDADGNYLDETPYGPIELPSGSPVAYTIKKSGFADKEEAGTVKGGVHAGPGRCAEGVPSPYGQPALEGYGGVLRTCPQKHAMWRKAPLPPPCSTNF